MNDLVEILRIGELFQKVGIPYEGRNFEELYDELYNVPNCEGLIEEVNNLVHDYFSHFQISDSVTIYDELILSLRKKDKIFSFNWDPLLIQAEKRNLHLGELPDIHFLHGNVAIGICIDHKRSGYFGNACSVCGNPFQQSKLLYPIKNKNYKLDPFVESEWKVIEHTLNESFIFTIFGYSAPNSDVIAKEMMLKAWNINNRKEFNEVEIVDVKPSDELLENWRNFTIRQHYATLSSIRDTLAFHYPRRSCDAFGTMIMMSQPWKEMKLPEFKTLTDLQNWVLPLIEEEIKFKNEAVPLMKFK